MRTRNRLLLVVLVGIWIGWMGQATVAASANPWLCENACTEAVACDTECWRTQFEFDQDYPSTTCEEEDYECCGDGRCDANSEGCNVCTDDCGELPTGCVDPDECYYNGQCDTGEVCNAAHECVVRAPVVSGPQTPTCGGSCTSNSNCCGVDVCLGQTGNMYCGIPSTTYCPSAPPCSGFYDSQPYDNCTELANLKCGPFQLDPSDVYCDPGINRCMFNQGFDCVAGNLGNIICS